MRRPTCEVHDLGRTGYGEASAMQRDLVARRKAGLIPDQLLLLEHPHTITLGRNGHIENLLASEEALRSAGIAFHETDRGGDITYHGPGQIVGYPLMDLKQWKRDVGAYVRAIEEVMIGALSDFDIAAARVPGCTGVWVEGRKIGAIGVHLSRWVSSHGFALNVNPSMSYFEYIVPCGLRKPVTSMEQLGSKAEIAAVRVALALHFGKVFGCDMVQPVMETVI